jgi:molybdopterin molybdotransferase
MLSVDEALKLVLEHAQSLPPSPRGTYLFRAEGRVLAEPIISDIDSPPHDKSVVDGYAVIAADITAAGTEFAVLEEVTAGKVPTRTVERGTATRIMTGAPLPRGADAVVMVEQTEAVGDRIRILQSPVKPRQNIMPRAASLARGQTVLQPGKRLRAIEIGLLSEVGRTMVSVISPPSVAIIATGNELVETMITPGPGQIRNSNGPLLAQLVKKAGGVPLPWSIARDERVDLRSRIQSGLEWNILLLSGGVSEGTLDLVPQVLRELNVTEVFHKVNLKPGKPLWFGTKTMCAGHTPLVFGLPGNPVSSLVCFELFVRPAIQKMCGLPPTGLRRMTAALRIDHQQRGDRPTYWPSALDDGQVTPLPWKGSGDLRTLTDANCLALFAAGDRLFRRGEEVEVLLLDE